MKYILHNTIATAMPTPQQTRLQELQARLCEARKSAKSNVGPNTEGETIVVTKQLVFDHLVAVCKANDINLLDIAEMLMSVDTVSEAEAEETKVAA